MPAAAHARGDRWTEETGPKGLVVIRRLLDVSVLVSWETCKICLFLEQQGIKRKLFVFFHRASRTTTRRGRRVGEEKLLPEFDGVVGGKMKSRGADCHDPWGSCVSAKRHAHERGPLRPLFFFLRFMRSCSPAKGWTEFFIQNQLAKKYWGKNKTISNNFQ
jgi:hypothetical protein